MTTLLIMGRFVIIITLIQTAGVTTKLQQSVDLLLKLGEVLDALAIQSLFLIKDIRSRLEDGQRAVGLMVSDPGSGPVVLFEPLLFKLSRMVWMVCFFPSMVLVLNS
jgi:hypothetical protein